jgi:hypothetical protein
MGAAFIRWVLLLTPAAIVGERCPKVTTDGLADFRIGAGCWLVHGFRCVVSSVVNDVFWKNVSWALTLPCRQRAYDILSSTLRDQGMMSVSLARVSRV